MKRVPMGAFRSRVGRAVEDVSRSVLPDHGFKIIEVIDAASQDQGGPIVDVPTDDEAAWAERSTARRWL